MEWLEVTIKTVSPAIDLLGARLTAIGYDSFIVDDSTDFQSFLAENTQYWDYVDEYLAQKIENVSQIRLYLENDAQALEKLSALKSELAAFRAQLPDRELGTLEICLENLQEEDWENNWKQYYQDVYKRQEPKRRCKFETIPASAPLRCPAPGKSPADPGECPFPARSAGSRRRHLRG